MKGKIKRIGIVGLEDAGKSILAMALGSYLGEKKKVLVCGFDAKRSVLDYYAEREGEGGILELSDFPFFYFRMNVEGEWRDVRDWEEMREESKRLIEKIDKMGFDYEIYEIPTSRTFMGHPFSPLLLAFLEYADLVIVPFRDEKGKEAVEGNLSSAKKLSGAREVKVLYLPLTKGGRIRRLTPIELEILYADGYKIEEEGSFWRWELENLKVDARTGEEAEERYKELLRRKDKLKEYGKDIWTTFFFDGGEIREGKRGQRKKGERGRGEAKANR